MTYHIQLKPLTYTKSFNGIYDLTLQCHLPVLAKQLPKLIGMTNSMSYLSSPRTMIRRALNLCCNG